MTDIALAASARDWPDRLHRFLLDHGGGRIVDRLMGPDQAREGSFEVLLIDDVCSFLSPRLVSTVKERGIDLIGVYVPEDGSDAKRRLLECGITDVIESQASPQEFLEKIDQTLAHRATGSTPGAVPSRRALSIAVTGPSDGVGMTEVSIAMARAISESVPAVLIDLDQTWPSIAQRLDLPVHPNVRTALDNAFHSPARLGSSFHLVEELRVVGGRADGGHGGPISRHETVSLLDALSGLADVVVVDAGPVRDLEGGLLREFDTVVVVGIATPVGVSRLIRTVHAVESMSRTKSVLCVVNMTDRNGYRRSETLSELNRAIPELPVVTLPFDRRLAGAAWDGTLAAGKRYRKAVHAVSDVVVRSMS